MTAAPSRAPVADEGSMSLLATLTTHSLDESYEEAAARRRAAPQAEQERSGPRVLVGVLVVLGLLTGAAAAHVRSRDDAATAARDQLAEEVSRRTDRTEALATQARHLRREVEQLQATALGADTAGQRAAAELAPLELSTGLVPVVGPGVLVRLDDADGAGQQAVDRGGAPGDGRVLDRDVQDVVNGLWAAGAEAISINDVRLTALTAVRSAGEAILVDFTPLSPPYLVRAVGDAGTLEPAFTEGPTGRRFAAYGALYDLGFTVSRESRLRLPAARPRALRSVQGAS
ncbi:MAG: hypothetical protein JWN57_1079 [Frankiales bacterium]|jgi:uncharacterized protein YlxW (UPF0749 family)|nr:hypothetical protein [Frankiales bacterium]